MLHIGSGGVNGGTGRRCIGLVVEQHGVEHEREENRERENEAEGVSSSHGVSGEVEEEDGGRCIGGEEETLAIERSGGGAGGNIQGAQHSESGEWHFRKF
ncbi:hypothetical protein L6452_19010 [Arctium lappa]|uniref:Uncharacterized protein n=1 Tax=Arctium lappa TaxID=4217 RepID=A0ACB9B6U9_ARCLA|nr:hypothetical protein L6452_19010 [Arctium lappa]